MRSIKKDLAGFRVLVTAGPTREFLDPVRFLSNPSTGRMGYAIATAARRRGARVTLITGPTEIAKPRGVELVSVVSAADMYRATLKAFPKSDLIFKTAAVADFRPQKISAHKIKKRGKRKLSLTLHATQDILVTLGKRKKKSQYLVGFAAETKRLTEHARIKLKKKRLDLIVANNVREKKSGFAARANQVTLLYADGRRKALPRMSKQRLADRLLNLTFRDYRTRPHRQGGYRQPR